MDPHIKVAIKRAIWKMFNSHTRGAKPSIGLFGSRRSGTTLLAQALGIARGLKIIDQPLSIFTADLVQKNYIPPYAGGFVHNPDSDEMERLSGYFTRIEEGKLHVGEPWRMWSGDFHFLTNRILYKFTDAHAIIEELEKIVPLYPICLFRHPIPQSLSCIRRNWPPRQRKIFFQNDLLDSFFDPNQQDFIKEKAERGSLLQRHLLSWFVENAPLLEGCIEGKHVFITYEYLVREPQGALQLVCEHSGIEYSEKMVAKAGKPSRSSSYRKSRSNVSRYLKEGNREEILTNWQKELTKQQKKEVREIFDVLGNSLYAWNEPMPARWRTQK